MENTEPKKVDALTLQSFQEAKDQVAFEMFSLEFKQLHIYASQIKVLEEAAERYARSKSEQIWLPIKDYPGYEISNFGHVRNGKQYITVHRNNSGYYRVALCKHSEKEYFFIHHLVAEYFIGPRPDGKVVMHIDSNRMNNYVSNLRYGTQSENINQAVSEGRRPSISNRLKTPADKVESIIALRKSGMMLKDIEKVSGLSLSTIQKLFTRNKIYAPKPEFKP